MLTPRPVPGFKRRSKTNRTSKMKITY